MSVNGWQTSCERALTAECRSIKINCRYTPFIISPPHTVGGILGAELYRVAHKNNHLNVCCFFAKFASLLVKLQQSFVRLYFLFTWRYHKLLQIQSVYFENKNLIVTCKQKCCAQWRNVLTLQSETKISLRVLKHRNIMQIVLVLTQKCWLVIPF